MAKTYIESIVRSVHIKMSIFPTTMQDVPAGKDEVADIQKFIDELQLLAQKYLPHAGHKMRIKEERITVERGGR